VIRRHLSEDDGKEQPAAEYITPALPFGPITGASSGRKTAENRRLERHWRWKASIRAILTPAPRYDFGPAPLQAANRQRDGRSASVKICASHGIM